MARKAGLGRGLDALFADVAPIYEEEYRPDDQEPENSDLSIDEDLARRARELAGIKDDSSDAAANKGRTGGKKTGSAGRRISASGRTGDGDNRSSRSSTPQTGRSAGGSGTGRGRAPEKTSRQDDSEDTQDRIIYIDINDIRPNSAQPRINFDEDKLRELAESINANGVIQPLIVRKSSSGYELVAGERRWRASRIAGLRKIPCIIRDFDDRQNAIVAIIENMQREDLNPIEEALGLRSMTEKYGFTQEQISASLGRSRTYIANSIRLLKLPEEIQAYVSSGQMSAAHGRTIINIPDRKRQKEIADKIIRNDLSVRATEKLAEKVKDELRPERRRRKKAEERSPAAHQTGKSADVIAAERELMSLFGTRVNITGEEKGRLELEFYSTEELNRLIDMLREAFR